MRREEDGVHRGDQIAMLWVEWGLATQLSSLSQRQNLMTEWNGTTAKQQIGRKLLQLTRHTETGQPQCLFLWLTNSRDDCHRVKQRFLERPTMAIHWGRGCCCCWCCSWWGRWRVNEFTSAAQSAPSRRYNWSFEPPQLFVHQHCPIPLVQYVKAFWGRKERDIILIRFTFPHSTPSFVLAALGDATRIPYNF